MSVADSKPDFENFLRPIVKTFKKYELGSKFRMAGEERLLRCFLLYGIYDKPARSAANNTTSSTGYYGCIKCTQKGTRLKTGNSKNFLRHFNLLITNNFNYLKRGWDSSDIPLQKFGNFKNRFYLQTTRQ